MCVFLLFLIGYPVTGPGAYADTKDVPVPAWRIERDIQRFKLVATDNVMKLLSIRPGMTILDIGAGTGQFSYEFARRLDGTGKVYATDTNDFCIDYMSEEADRRGLKNLQPVLVKRDGVDGFYGKHRYDLVAMFHLSLVNADQVDYFRELRGFLAEDGRLVLILYKIPTPFSPYDFTGDFPGLIRELSLEPPESPYYKILKGSTRKLITDNPGAEPSEALKNAIVEDFKEALVDPGFSAHFFKGSVFRKEAAFSPAEERYADWLLLPFHDNSALKRRIKPGNASGAGRVKTINKLLLMQRFRKYLKSDGLFRSGFPSPVRAALEKAGYRVDREYPDLIPFEDMIVLSARQ